jgi:hypothetical protein
METRIDHPQVGVRQVPGEPVGGDDRRHVSTGVSGRPPHSVHEPS